MRELIARDLADAAVARLSADRRRAGADGRFLASAFSRRDSFPARLRRVYALRQCAVLQAD
jgi:hypothetical protein